MSHRAWKWQALLKDKCPQNVAGHSEGRGHQIAGKIPAAPKQKILTPSSYILSPSFILLTLFLFVSTLEGAELGFPDR